MERPLQFSHRLLEEIIHRGDEVIDATVGNGYDTVFLADLVGEEGKVWGFDIQSQAIQVTKERLVSQKLDGQVQLIHAGHEQIDQYISPDHSIQAAVFNLGYLPKGDKSIITHPKTTLQALDHCLTRLVSGGLISIMVYFGHAGGENERDAILKFSQQLPQNDFTVYHYQIINQINQPPFLLIIEKK